MRGKESITLANSNQCENAESSLICIIWVHQNLCFPLTSITIIIYMFFPHFSKLIFCWVPLNSFDQFFSIFSLASQFFSLQFLSANFPTFFLFLKFSLVEEKVTCSTTCSEEKFIFIRSVKSNENENPRRTWASD
jgi:hypothetical protein